MYRLHHEGEDTLNSVGPPGTPKTALTHIMKTPGKAPTTGNYLGAFAYFAKGVLAEARRLEAPRRGSLRGEGSFFA